MSQFPRSRTEVLRFAERMLSGYAKDPEAYPHKDVKGLKNALTDCKRGDEDSAMKEAALRRATETGNKNYARIEKLLKSQMKHADVDTGGDPEKLAAIGCARTKPQSRKTPPLPPCGLEILAKGPGTMDLKWTKAKGARAKTIRMYRIDRRERTAPGKPYGNWQEVTAVLETRRLLVNQPQGVQLEYRIVAVNQYGESASESIEVTL